VLTDSEVNLLVAPSITGVVNVAVFVITTLPVPLLFEYLTFPPASSTRVAVGLVSGPLNPVNFVVAPEIMGVTRVEFAGKLMGWNVGSAFRLAVSTVPATPGTAEVTRPCASVTAAVLAFKANPY
jgi:hypothetical protein